MKYATIVFSLLAGAYALPQDASSTITSAPASAASAGLTPQQSCAINSCAAGDVTCQASCLGIAHPNSSQADQTTECAANCDQGDGSPSATEKYSQCVQACISSYFPTSQTVGGVAQPASGSASASATGSAASATGSAATQTTSGAVSATGTGAASSASPTGAATSNSIQLTGAGLAGLALAFFAL